MIDGEERISDDRATMIAIESNGDGGALIDRFDADDAADRHAVLRHRITAFDSMRVVEDDRRLDFAVMHEPSRAEPDADGEHDQKCEREKPAHEASVYNVRVRGTFRVVLKRTSHFRSPETR